MSELRWKNMKIAHGKPPTGCVQCEKGAKMVLLATGLCDIGCWYCPLSTKKLGNDVVFANELRMDPGDMGALLKEARMIDALGTGITGGDPAVVLDRTVGYIGGLKEAFGSAHHVHMYTGTPLDAAALGRLSDAGLDEIRLHPRPAGWRKLPEPYRKAAAEAMDRGIVTGFEVPAIPGMKREILALIDTLEAMEVAFINLNELEYSETNWDAMREREHTWRSDTSNAIRGSEKIAVQAVTFAHDADLNMTVHFCSSAYKDGVQLRNRLRRRAKNVACARDVITPDGTIMKGIVESDEPGRLAEELSGRFDIPSGMIGVSEGRVEVAPWVLEEIASEIDEKAFIIEVYPTEDRLEVERSPLN